MLNVHYYCYNSVFGGLEPVDWDRVALGLLPSQASLAGTSTSTEHRAHGYYSSSDEEGRSSEEEADTTVNIQAEEIRCVCVCACCVCVCVCDICCHFVDVGY